MPINGVQANNNVQQNRRKRNNALGTVAAGGALGLAGGGAYGYTRNLLVNKDGFYTDQFVARVAKDFEKGDKEAYAAIKAAGEEFDNLFYSNQKEVKLTAAQKKQLAALDADVQKYIIEELSIPDLDETKITEFIKKHAEKIGISPKEGQSLDDAVKIYMQERPKYFLNRPIMEDENVDKLFKSVISKITGKGEKAVVVPRDNKYHALRAVIDQDLGLQQYSLMQTIEVHKDFDWVSKYMDNFFDRAGKKFKKAGDDIPKDMVDAFKKAAKEINTTSAKLKNAAIFGGLAALVAGAAASVSSMFINKNS